MNDVIDEIVKGNIAVENCTEDEVQEALYDLQQYLEQLGNEKNAVHNLKVFKVVE